MTHGRKAIINLPLTREQEVSYLRICEELKEKSYSLNMAQDMLSGSFSVASVRALPPVECPFLGTINPHTKCIVTGDRIKRWDRVVMIFSEPIPTDGDKPKKVILGVFKNREALDELLACGSLEALKAKRREERGILPPRPEPFIPLHMQVMHCVQCGVRMLRPEDMSLFAFGKLMRCDACKNSGISMKKGDQRHCRRCGTKYVATEGAKRLCPWCMRDEGLNN